MKRFLKGNDQQDDLDRNRQSEHPDSKLAISFANNIKKPNFTEQSAMKGEAK